jgi:hypothetical protein
MKLIGDGLENSVSEGKKTYYALTDQDNNNEGMNRDNDHMHGEETDGR